MRITYRITPSARIRIMMETSRDPRIMQHLNVDPAMLSEQDEATLATALHSADGEHIMLVIPGSKRRDERDLMALEQVADLATVLAAYRAIIEER